MIPQTQQCEAGLTLILDDDPEWSTRCPVEAIDRLVIYADETEPAFSTLTVHLCRHHMDLLPSEAVTDPSLN